MDTNYIIWQWKTGLANVGGALLFVIVYKMYTVGVVLISRCIKDKEAMQTVLLGYHGVGNGCGRATLRLGRVQEQEQKGSVTRNYM